MFWDAQDLKKLDPVVLITFAILALTGLLAVYSATQSSNPAIQSNFIKQVIWVALGLVVGGVVVMLPLKILHQYAYGLYVFSIFLLVLVLLAGKGQGGVHRWFVLGPLRFQPSEFAKIATLFALARFLANERRNLGELRQVFAAFAIVLLPTALIMKEPDLGTALVFMAIVLPMMYWGGLSLFSVFVIIAPVITLVSAFTFVTFFIAMLFITAAMIISQRGLKVIVPNFLLNIGVGILTPILWSHLHAYQKSRILTFLGLQQDPRGLGYQVLQSKVAIGSGGLFGKGWLHGTQTQLRFLPEQHTDFIFSVVGEEFGFIGVILVLAAFFFLFWRAFKIAYECRSRFASQLVIGASTILIFQVMVNVGMTVGIMPVTGLPLPFLSYGGTAMLTSIVLIALILNASRRRFQYL